MSAHLRDERRGCFPLLVGLTVLVLFVLVLGVLILGFLNPAIVFHVVASFGLAAISIPFLFVLVSFCIAGGILCGVAWVQDRRARGAQIVCPGCRYDRSGLEDQACPECGTKELPIDLRDRSMLG